MIFAVVITHAKVQYEEFAGLFEKKTGCSGFISSPNFPQLYDDGMVGHYLIQAPKGNVSLTSFYSTLWQIIK